MCVPLYFLYTGNTAKSIGIMFRGHWLHMVEMAGLPNSNTNQSQCSSTQHGSVGQTMKNNSVLIVNLAPIPHKIYNIFQISFMTVLYRQIIFSQESFTTSSIFTDDK